MEDEQAKPLRDAMSNDTNAPVADDAVSNRSDDTALDEADVSRAGEHYVSPLQPSREESPPEGQESEAAVGPATAEQQAYEAAEAEQESEIAETDQEAEVDAVDGAAAEADEEEPVRVSRGPVYEEPQVEEEIHMDWYILKVQSNRERSIAEALERKMRIEGLDRFFDAVLGTDGIPHKPAPDLLLLCARTVEREPSRGLMIGDTDRDLQAGRAAGMRTCGVTWGVLGAEGLRPHAPDFLISRFSELIPIVNGLTNF